MMTGQEKIFKWVPGYLAWLNLHWGVEGEGHHLAQVRSAAQLLENDSAYWAAILRDGNWRPPLIACVCLLVAGKRDFFDLLRDRFSQGSMVSPQIAVTMGLLHPVETADFLESILSSKQIDSAPRRFVSAQTVLTLLGRLPESQVCLGDWTLNDKDEADLAHRIVKKHWEFWRPRVQPPAP